MLVQADKHHNADQFQCEQCPHKTNSKYNLKQHMQGAHGPSWQALCGKTFSWRARKARHEKSCEDCAKVTTKINKKASKLKAKLKK